MGGELFLYSRENFVLVVCPYGLGDSATVLPKLASLANDKRIDSLTYYLTGYYPHLLYRFFINFDFGVRAKYILSPWSESDVIDTEVIQVHPQKINELNHIPDIVVPEKYWERHTYLERIHHSDMAQIMGAMLGELDRRDMGGFEKHLNQIWRKFRDNRLASDIILSRFVRNRKGHKDEHCVVFQPVTTLRTPRNFVAERMAELYNKVITALEGFTIYLVGTYDDYLSIKELVDSVARDSIINTMGRWDVAQIVQLIFDADVVLGCNSWVPYLGSICDKRSAMYVLGGLQVEAEFRNRIVSENFYGFDDISLRQSLNIDKMVHFLAGS